MIDQFRDKDWAIRVNRLLIEYERFCPEYKEAAIDFLNTGMIYKQNVAADRKAAMREKLATVK